MPLVVLYLPVGSVRIKLFEKVVKMLLRVCCRSSDPSSNESLSKTNVTLVNETSDVWLFDRNLAVR